MRRAASSAGYMDVLIDLAERLRGRRDIGFLFVGRGSDED